MAPDKHQKVEFKHFHALATQWAQEVPRRSIFSASWSMWAPLGHLWSHKHFWEADMLILRRVFNNLSARNVILRRVFDIWSARGVVLRRVFEFCLPEM